MNANSRRSAMMGVLDAVLKFQLGHPFIFAQWANSYRGQWTSGGPESSDQFYLRPSQLTIIHNGPRHATWTRSIRVPKFNTPARK